MQVKLVDIKKLREETQAGVSDCRQALVDAGGDYQKAKNLINEQAIDIAAGKNSRATAQGIISGYVHATGKVGVLLELRCETDFVARTEIFRNLAHELCLQITAMDHKNVKQLLASSYIRDSSLNIADLIKQTIAKVGENITVGKFYRLTLGEK